MKTDNTSSHQTNIPPATLPLKKENFRVEYKICGYGGGETVFEIAGGYDIPLGMQRENLHNTIRANEVIFEASVMAPMKMAVIHSLEGQFRRGTKKPVSTAEDRYSPTQQIDLIAATSPQSKPDRASPVADPFPPDQTEVAPKMPVYSEMPPAPAPAGCRIVNPVPKTPAKPQRSPKASVAALPGDEGEKMVA